MVRKCFFILRVTIPFLFSNFNYLPGSKNLDIQIVLPDKSTQENSSPCLQIKVLIINNTDTINSFFEDWNAWGYNSLRFDVKAGDSVYHLYRKEKFDWGKNFPSFEVLFPGDTMIFEYKDEPTACNFSQFRGLHNVITRGNYSIKAVYNLHPLILNDAMGKSFIDSTKMIKYKYKRINGNRSRNKEDFIIVDSVQTPVPLVQTFPYRLSRSSLNYTDLK